MLTAWRVARLPGDSLKLDPNKLPWLCLNSILLVMTPPHMEIYISTKNTSPSFLHQEEYSSRADESCDVAGKKSRSIELSRETTLYTLPRLYELQDFLYGAPGSYLCPTDYRGNMSNSIGNAHELLERVGLKLAVLNTSLCPD